MVRPPAIALGVASSVDPGLDGLALFGEADVVVTVIGCVRVKIDVIIMKAPGDVMLGTDFCNLLHVFNCTKRW